MLATEPGKLRFGLLARLDVNEVGQPLTEAPDDRDMSVADGTVALRGGGGLQSWRQRFTSDRKPRSPRSSAS